MTGTFAERWRSSAAAWGSLLVPFAAGLVARSWAPGAVHLGTVDPGVEPYGVLGEIFAVRDGMVVALDAGPDARRLGVRLREGAGALAFDVAERVYWGEGDVLHVRDLLTGKEESVAVQGAVLDTIVDCDGLLALTSMGTLVRWSPGQEPFSRPVPEGVLGIFTVGECGRVGARTAATVGYLDIASGDFDARVEHPEVGSVVRWADGFLTADATGAVIRWTADGKPMERWTHEQVEWVCDPIAGRACVVDREGAVWLLP